MVTPAYTASSKYLEHLLRDCETDCETDGMSAALNQNTGGWTSQHSTAGSCRGLGAAIFWRQRRVVRSDKMSAPH